MTLNSSAVPRFFFLFFFGWYPVLPEPRAKFLWRLSPGRKWTDCLLDCLCSNVCRPVLVSVLSLWCEMSMSVATSQTEAASSSAWTNLAGSTAPAGRGTKFGLMTSPSVSVSQTPYIMILGTKKVKNMKLYWLTSLLFQLCVTLPVRTMECVWPQTAVTVLQATLVWAAQVQTCTVYMDSFHILGR